MRVRRDAGVSTDFACARLRSRLAADRIASPSMYPYSKCLLRRPTYYRCGAYRYTGRSIAATRTCYLYSMRWVLGHNVLSLNAYLSESYSTSRRVLRSYRQATVCAARVLRCTYVIIDYMPYVRGPVPCAALPPGLRPECESEPRIARLSVPWLSAPPRRSRGRIYTSKNG